MKKLLYRLPRNRWFARLLSILAVAVVAFAALELLADQQALAGIRCCKTKAGTTSTPDTTDCICDGSTSCNITKISNVTKLTTTYNRQVTGSCWNLSDWGAASTVTSTINCENVGGTGEIFLTPASLTQSALLKCEINDSAVPAHNDKGFCQWDISYSRPAGLTQCVNNPGNPGPNDDTSTLTYAAFCSQAFGGSTQNKLTVTGTLKCPATLQDPPVLGEVAGVAPGWCENGNCILNVGIKGAASGDCPELFPAGSELVPPVPELAGLAEGQVLSFSQTVAGSNCPAESEAIALGQPITRYCTGQTFSGAPVGCTVGSGQNQNLFTGTGIADAAIGFDVTFAPTTLNVKCAPQNNDTWNFTIVGNQHLNLTEIDRTSLAVEGVPDQVTNCSINTVANTMTCDIQACSSVQGQEDVGPKLGASSLNGKTANVTVTGTLTDNPTPIFGEDQNHKISGL
jgi:hypothetical protein